MRIKGVAGAWPTANTCYTLLALERVEGCAQALGLGGPLGGHRLRWRRQGRGDRWFFVMMSLGCRSPICLPLLGRVTGPGGIFSQGDPGHCLGVYTEAGGGRVGRATREGPPGLGDSQRKARASQGFHQSCREGSGSEDPWRGLGKMGGDIKSSSSRRASALQFINPHPLTSLSIF